MVKRITASSLEDPNVVQRSNASHNNSSHTRYNQHKLVSDANGNVVALRSILTREGDNPRANDRRKDYIPQTTGVGLYPRIGGYSHNGVKIGQQPFHITDEMRTMVKMLAGHGLTQEQIRQYIINPRTGNPITDVTLNKHFQNELDTGRMELNLAVSMTVLKQALGAPAEYDKHGNCIKREIQPYFPAGQWWEKSRAGMTEKIIQEHDAKDGTKVQLIIEG